MLSHGNIVSAIAGFEAQNESTSAQIYLSYLPLAHIMVPFLLKVSHCTGTCFSYFFNAHWIYYRILQWSKGKLLEQDLNYFRISESFEKIFMQFNRLKLQELQEVYFSFQNFENILVYQRIYDTITHTVEQVSYISNKLILLRDHQSNDDCSTKHSIPKNELLHWELRPLSGIAWFFPN